MAQLAYSRRLFATKHYGAARATAIRAVLALGHGLRIVALMPRLARREGRTRIRAELRALGVQVGLAGPPYPGSGEAGDRSAPRRQRALLLDAVHVFGVETLEEGDDDIELRIADFGIDVRKPSTGEIIGRLRWDEVRSVAVPRPRNAQAGQPSHARFVLGADHGEVIFELPGVSEGDITEHLEPLIARNCASYSDPAAN